MNADHLQMLFYNGPNVKACIQHSISSAARSRAICLPVDDVKSSVRVKKYAQIKGNASEREAFEGIHVRSAVLYSMHYTALHAFLA